MSILITYGSQTGMTHKVAENLMIGIQKLFVNTEDQQYIVKSINSHIIIELEPLNNIDIDELSNYELIIILLSTTGDGAFPENASKFWDRLRKHNQNIDVDYLLCGFGDR